MNLFVRNLAYSVTEEKLREEFESIGAVESARVILDRDTGRSRGFGFVQFANQEDGQKAISELDGKEIDGRAISVQEANENKGRRRNA